ncbi:MAG: methylenetetrahydrofolate reductase, partial [Endomicrobiia bacterium]
MMLKELFFKKFVITAEIGPPKGWQVESLIQEAKKYLVEKIDAINVTDNQASVMKFGSLGMSILLKQNGFEPIYQITCRDRNRIALQSDILNAAAFGIENLLLLTGDHPILGDHKNAKPVFDLDSVSLIYTVKQLMQGYDLSGNKLLGEPPKFYIGAVVNPETENLDLQIFKMEKKINAGAEFFQTQLVFNPEKFIKFINIVRKNFGKIPIMPGITILKSANMAKFMNENIPGINIPENIIKQLEEDKEKTKSGQKGLEIAAKIIKDIKPYCEGIHIMPLGWINKIP